MCFKRGWRDNVCLGDDNKWLAVLEPKKIGCLKRMQRMMGKSIYRSSIWVSLNYKFLEWWRKTSNSLTLVITLYARFRYTIFLYNAVQKIVPENPIYEENPQEWYSISPTKRLSLISGKVVDGCHRVSQIDSKACIPLFRFNYIFTQAGCITLPICSALHYTTGISLCDPIV